MMSNIINARENGAVQFRDDIADISRTYNSPNRDRSRSRIWFSGASATRIDPRGGTLIFALEERRQKQPESLPLRFLIVRLIRDAGRERETAGETISRREGQRDNTAAHRFAIG